MVSIEIKHCTFYRKHNTFCRKFSLQKAQAVASKQFVLFMLISLHCQWHSRNHILLPSDSFVNGQFMHGSDGDAWVHVDSVILC